jgi:hypothetical protein
MAAVVLVTIFVGFARTYYLAGVFGAPLPSLTVHLHGAAFSCWVLLFIAQVALVSAHRVDLHRRLGVFGFCLAAAMVILGVLAATESLFRRASVAARIFYIIPLADMLAFSTLIILAYRFRSNPAAHKRLILIATIALLEAGFARWPYPAHWWNLRMAEICTCGLLLLVVAYDLFSLRTIHRATLWAGLSVAFVEQVRHPIGNTAFWQNFAAWVQSFHH